MTSRLQIGAVKYWNNVIFNCFSTYNIYRAFSLASVRWTLESCPKQNRSMLEGFVYPSTVTLEQLYGTLNVSPTCWSSSKYEMVHQNSGAANKQWCNETRTVISLIHTNWISWMNMLQGYEIHYTNILNVRNSKIQAH